MITPKPATVFDLFNGHPERWTKGEFARNAHGNWSKIYGEDAACWCVRGAACLVYGHDTTATRKLADALAIDRWNVADWNDAPSTTFDMMLAKVKEAGI